MWETTIPQAGGVSLEHETDFITHPAENFHLFGFVSGGVGRIVEAPMMAIHLSRKHWTYLIRLAAHSDDGVNGLVQKFVEMLRAVFGNINTDLSHGFDRERMHIARWLAARAGHVNQIAGRPVQNSFRYMAATRIARAKNENGWF